MPIRHNPRLGALVILVRVSTIGLFLILAFSHRNDAEVMAVCLLSVLVIARALFQDLTDED